MASKVRPGSAARMSFSFAAGHIAAFVTMTRREDGTRRFTSMERLFVEENIDPAVLLENWFRREVGQAGSTNVTSDTGVLPVMFNNPDAINIQGVDGTLGMQGYLGTNEASRIEFAGTWGSSAANLQVLTNDVNGVSLEGSPYAFSFAQQIASPNQPSVRTG